MNRKLNLRYNDILIKNHRLNSMDDKTRISSININFLLMNRKLNLRYNDILIKNHRLNSMDDKTRISYRV